MICAYVCYQKSHPRKPPDKDPTKEAVADAQDGDNKDDMFATGEVVEVPCVCVAGDDDSKRIASSPEDEKTNVDSNSTLVITSTRTLAKRSEPHYMNQRECEPVAVGNSDGGEMMQESVKPASNQLGNMHDIDMAEKGIECHCQETDETSTSCFNAVVRHRVSCSINLS